jgi:hypothetical protein
LTKRKLSLRLLSEHVCRLRRISKTLRSAQLVKRPRLKPRLQLRRQPLRARSKMTGRQQPLQRRTSKIVGTQILIKSQPQMERQSPRLKSPRRRANPRMIQRTNASRQRKLPRPSERRRPLSAEKRPTRLLLQLVLRTIFVLPFAVFWDTSIPERLSYSTRSDSPTFRRAKPVALHSKLVLLSSLQRLSSRRPPSSTRMARGR